MQDMKLTIFIVIVCQMARAQSQLNVAQSDAVPANMPAIEALRATCNGDNMTINVTFDRPYNGTIYSKGFFSDPACRYVQEPSPQTSIEFSIPLSGCGTSSSGNTTEERFENVLIFQMNMAVQEVWDQARKVSCGIAEDRNLKKLVKFQPVAVGMLDVVTVPLGSDMVDCWMDIQIGKFPNSHDIDGVVKIGEEMSLLIYLNDKGKGYDIKVLDCYAYDEQDFNTSNANGFQLSGSDGCPLRPKLFGFWMRTRDTENTGATTIAFNRINAFKFPDKRGIFVTCNVEICQTECQNRCPGEPSEPVTLAVTLSTGTTSPSRKTESAETTETILPTGQSVSTMLTPPIESTEPTVNASITEGPTEPQTTKPPIKPPTLPTRPTETPSSTEATESTGNSSTTEGPTEPQTTKPPIKPPTLPTRPTSGPKVTTSPTEATKPTRNASTTGGPTEPQKTKPPIKPPTLPTRPPTETTGETMPTGATELTKPTSMESSVKPPTSTKMPPIEPTESTDTTEPTQTDLTSRPSTLTPSTRPPMPSPTQPPTRTTQQSGSTSPPGKWAKDADSRFHAFHSWLYDPQLRGKRSAPAPSTTIISLGSRSISVQPK